MLKIENVAVNGWDAAIRGMRNPMNSWAKSDSCECNENIVNRYDCPLANYNDEPACECHNGTVGYCIGKNDMALMQKLFKGGTEHRKFMRFITVTMDVTAPLYWWKEFDTYKIGTVSNSCSTMHKIHAKELTMNDFSHDQLTFGNSMVLEQKIIPILNLARDNFLETKDKMWWWQMIQLLPSSYNQKRTVFMNYETCANIYKQRKNHNLDEWRMLCNKILMLPYFAEIIGGAKDEV